MKLFWSFIVSLIVATTLSANCGKCDMQGMQKAQQGQMNCKMHKKKNCEMKNCANKQMKKKHCNMKAQKNCKMNMKTEGSCGAGKCGSSMKKASCGQGKCGASMSKNEMSGDSGKKMKGSCGVGKCGASMKKGSCGQGKCGANMKEKKEAKNCGCGMTVKSCKEMMSYCKFRDGEKKNK